jgi:hypothetical protein
MARVIAIGPCLGQASQDAGTHNYGSDFLRKNSKDGTELGYSARGWANVNSNNRFREDANTAITTLTNQVGYRFWIRVRRYTSYAVDTLGVACGKANLMSGQRRGRRRRWLHDRQWRLPRLVESR